MKRVVIVQARMGSSRLPGKVLMDLDGRPMLSQQLSRLRRCERADDIVVATTRHATDDPIVELCRREDCRWFRGSESDVLERYLGAAHDAQAELVVRVTADCPLIDPGLVDRVVAELETHSHDADYASNIVDRTYPRGLDTEAFFIDTLERVARMATSAPSREHVTHFILQEQPNLFAIRSITDGKNNSDLRWTVDVDEDLRMVRRLYAAMGPAVTSMDYNSILAMARARPDITNLNAHVNQKPLAT